MYATNIELEISKGENDTQDFKHEISSSLKIAKTLVAFANTKGGRLWIGVKDNGKIIGCEPSEEQYMIEHACQGYCKPTLNPEFLRHKIDDKFILEVRVPCSDQRPHYAKDENDKWWAYVRDNDHTVLAGIITLGTWKSKREDVLIRYREIEKNILLLLGKECKMNLLELVEKLKVKRFVVIKILVKLVSAGILKISYQKNLEVFEQNSI